MGEASSGLALGRVLGVLVSRLLATAPAAGRSLRTVVLSAQLLAGGGWRERVVFRQPLVDAERIRLALSVRLLALPGPAGRLGLSVECFGAADRRAGGAAGRRGPRVGSPACRPGRAAAGGAGAGRARWRGHRRPCASSAWTPTSRVPERRVVLTPIPE